MRIFCFILMIGADLLIFGSALRYHTLIGSILHTAKKDDYKHLRTLFKVLRYFPFLLVLGYSYAATDLFFKDVSALSPILPILSFGAALFIASAMHVQILSTLSMRKENELLLASHSNTSSLPQNTVQENNAQSEAFLRQSKLLTAANEAAALLLSADIPHFEDALRNSMQLVAACADIDRVRVWSNHSQDGEPYYKQLFSWSAPGQHAPILLQNSPGLPEGAYFYKDTFPQWLDTFQQKKSVNGNISRLSDIEQQPLSTQNIRSILATPIFHQDTLWGFVSFSDCHSERVFSEDIENILHSTGLLFANALIRHEDELAAITHLAQQKAIVKISQDLVAKGDISDQIASVLETAGSMLCASRVLLSLLDKESSTASIFAKWQSEEGSSQPLAEFGFNTLLSSDFPMEMPESTSVPLFIYDHRSSNDSGAYKALQADSMKAFLWAPLYIENRLYGVLRFESSSKTRIWSENDSQIAGMLASIIAGALTRDLTEKVRLSDLEQALNASKAKGDFLSNMSHEMRTPMNAIMGMTTIGRAAASIEKKDYAFEKIESASSHMLGVINDILDMSKIEANKMELSFTEFNFEKMLQKIVGIINFRVEEKHREFTVYIDRHIPTNLISDDQRLAQVITNLLSNAVKFTPDSGRIELNTKLIETKGDMVTLQVSVSDTGIGLSEEQISRLFTSFSQANSNISRNFGGTGLGLAISKRIIELMDGKIWLESQLDQGTTFYFEITIRRGENAPHSPMCINAHLNNVRLLVVDDAPFICSYFSEVIMRSGITCDTALSGEEALSLINVNNPYDLYFIDWKMPGINGLELSSKINQMRRDNANIVLMSSSDWSLIENDAVKVGVSKFLPKPLFPSMIIDVINEHFGIVKVSDTEQTQKQVLDDFSNNRILLVEDVHINQEIVLALLEDTHLNIDCAENGVEAVRMYSESPDIYHMIFMDIQMPLMDGFEATRSIRSLGIPHAKWIPIVAMTANVFREDVEKCIEAGMDDHIGKPIDVEEMLAILRKYLSKSFYPDQDASDSESFLGEQRLDWLPAYETGIESIDSQHKKIYNLAEQLLLSHQQNQAYAIIAGNARSLISFILQHFEDEEALQRQNEFYDYNNHLLLHTAFKKKIQKLEEDLSDGDSLEHFMIEVNALIIRWMVQHIQGEDIKIANHLHRRLENA